MDDVCIENVSRKAIYASDHDTGQKSISDMDRQTVTYSEYQSRDSNTYPCRISLKESAERKASEQKLLTQRDQKDR